MPALKKTRDQQADLILKGAIGRGKAITSMPTNDMGQLLGVSLSTYHNRMRRPGNFTLAEIRVMYRKFGFTDEEILGFVKGVM